MTKTQKRKARAARTAARHAENASSSGRSEKPDASSAGAYKDTIRDSPTGRAKGLDNNAINNNQQESDDEEQSEFNTPEPRNDLAAVSAVVPRVRRVADRSTNTVQTRITWIRAKTANSTTRDDEADEEPEVDEVPVERTRVRTMTTRSSRRFPSPSPEEELMDEEGGDGEQQGGCAPYEGPSMNKAPCTVCFEEQFTDPFTTTKSLQWHGRRSTSCRH
jgi:hypothetical protein